MFLSVWDKNDKEKQIIGVFRDIAVDKEIRDKVAVGCYLCIIMKIASPGEPTEFPMQDPTPPSPHCSPIPPMQSPTEGVRRGDGARLRET